MPHEPRFPVLTLGNAAREALLGRSRTLAVLAVTDIVVHYRMRQEQLPMLEGIATDVIAKLGKR